MHDDGEDARTGVPGAGLCNACVHQRVVVSGRGSAFTLCRLASENPSLRRYPVLPVLSCSSFVLVRKPQAADARTT